jgi:hypothetical protein
VCWFCLIEKQKTHPQTIHPHQTLHYDVTNVPTFVTLDDRGAARARAGRPADADAAVAAVGHMVGVARPKRVKK